MINYIAKRLQQLKNIYESNINNFCLTFLNAMDGMGKKTTIEAFLDEIGYDDVLEVNPYGTVFPLHSFISSFDNKFDNEPLLQLNKSQIQKNIKDSILKNLSKKSRIIVIFNNLNQFDDETAFFIFDMAKLLVNINSKKTILFLITNDETITFSLRNRIKNLSRYTNYVYFPDWDVKDLNELLNEVYPCSSISQECLRQIINCSFKNAGVFLNNIEYLKEHGYLYFQNKSLKCHTIPDDVLFSNYKDIIQSRYEHLEPEMKDALEKASIVGVHFDAITIQNALNLNMAAQLMSEVEQISRLIFQIDVNESGFEFVNSETHRLIESYIPLEKKKSWNIALASYYENQIMSSSAIAILSDGKFCEYSILAAFYFENSKMSEKALALYFKIIPILMNQSFYHKSLDLIARSQKILLYQKMASKRLNVQLLYWEYECNFALFNMKSGLNAFRNYRKNVDLTEIEAIRADYEEALLLYDSDYTNLAYKKTIECYDKIQNFGILEKELLRLKIQIISLLCSIEETLLIDSYQIHYNEAIELAKNNHFLDLYYSLVRKSGIAYSSDICIKRLRTAARYFSTRNKIEYAMTLHNLASEELFYGNHTNSLKNFNRAYSIFLDYGHNGIICVKNGLSIYNSIYNKAYGQALDYIYNFATDYNEDFLVLVIYYNTITILRKMDKMDEAKKYFKKTCDLNKKKSNRYPYFARFLYAQEGYFALAENQLEKAWNCFETFFRHDYNDRVEYSLSVAITMAKLALKIERPLPSDIQIASETSNKLAKYLSTEKLIFCEILFWE